MSQDDRSRRPMPKPPKASDYEPPRIVSEKVFETHSLVTCSKVSGDPGCMQGGPPPDGIIGS